MAVFGGDFREVSLLLRMARCLAIVDCLTNFAFVLQFQEIARNLVNLWQVFLAKIFVDFLQNIEIRFSNFFVHKKMFH